MAEPNCSLCQRITKDFSIKTGFVSLVIDYKDGAFDAPGFPQGGTVTIQGWKLKEISEFTTCICSDCVEAARSNYADRREQGIANLRRATRICRSIFAAAGLLALSLFAFERWGVPTAWVHVTAIIAAIIAAGCGVIGLCCHVDANNYDNNHVKEFDPKDPARRLHEKVMVDTAGIHVPKGTKNIFALPERDSFARSISQAAGAARSARLGDVLVHRHSIADFVTYPTGGGWSLILATWKTHGSSDTSGYSTALLNQSMTNQGFASAGDFLNHRAMSASTAG